jgi:hypothetical protein
LLSARVFESTSLCEFLLSKSIKHRSSVKVEWSIRQVHAPQLPELSSMPERNEYCVCTSEEFTRTLLYWTKRRVFFTIVFEHFAVEFPYCFWCCVSQRVVKLLSWALVNHQTLTVLNQTHTYIQRVVKTIIMILGACQSSTIDSAESDTHTHTYVHYHHACVCLAD